MVGVATAAESAGRIEADVAPRISIVIPVHNERANLPQLHSEIQAVFADSSMIDWRPVELIFVEDGSTDGTATWVDACAREHARTTAIHLMRSYGQSAALAAGFDRAVGEVIIPMDGDLQNDPADIPRLLAEIEAGADCVSGWRRDREDPWHKTIPSAIQTRLAKFTGPDIHDFGCTLTAYRSAAIDDINLRGERHRYIPAQLHRLGYDVTEVEVNHRPRKHGNSRYGVGRLLRGFVDLVFALFAVRYRTRPMHLFGGGGLVITTIGLLLGTWLVAQRYLGGLVLGDALPRLLLAVTLTLFGVGMVGFGIISELLVELLYRDERPYRIADIHE